MKNYGKRVVDIIGASIGLLASFPILLIAAICIRLDSKGSVLFSQARCTKDGKIFRCWKLRTMVDNAEDKLDNLSGHNEMTGPVFKMKNDPRITKVGAVLRRYSIDELPQFWNVLRGDLSLIGPRPPQPREVINYTDYQYQRLNVNCGLTCYWQVDGRNTINNFDEWVELDLKYINNQSIKTDCLLLIKTIPAIFKGHGAY